MENCSNHLSAELESARTKPISPPERNFDFSQINIHKKSVNDVINFLKEYSVVMQEVTSLKKLMTCSEISVLDHLKHYHKIFYECYDIFMKLLPKNIPFKKRVDNIRTCISVIESYYAHNPYYPILFIINLTNETLHEMLEDYQTFLHNFSIQLERHAKNQSKKEFVEKKE